MLSCDEREQETFLQPKHCPPTPTQMETLDLQGAPAASALEESGPKLIEKRVRREWHFWLHTHIPEKKQLECQLPDKTSVQRPSMERPAEIQAIEMAPSKLREK